MTPTPQHSNSRHARSLVPYTISLVTISTLTLVIVILSLKLSDLGASRDRAVQAASEAEDRLAREIASRGSAEGQARESDGTRLEAERAAEVLRKAAIESRASLDRERDAHASTRSERDTLSQALQSPWELPSTDPRSLLPRDRPFVADILVSLPDDGASGGGMAITESFLIELLGDRMKARGWSLDPASPDGDAVYVTLKIDVEPWSTRSSNLRIRAEVGTLAPTRDAAGSAKVVVSSIDNALFLDEDSNAREALTERTDLFLDWCESRPLEVPPPSQDAAGDADPA
jgi:hypothetical protein